VASLIFVGTQINQGNQVAKARIIQSLETDMQIFAITMDQSALAKADYKLTKGEALNDYEKHQLEKYREFSFRDYDNSFYQYQIDLFEEEAWQAYRILFKKLLIRIQNTQKCGVIIKKALAFYFQKKLN